MTEEDACPSAQALHLMGKIAHPVAVELEVDLHARTAEFGVSAGFGIRIGKRADPWDIAGKFQNTAVIDIVHHGPVFRVFCGIFNDPRRLFRRRREKSMPCRLQPLSQSSIDTI
jgi:hypothetical protein